jgi:diguanylate cyclase (GGDEF)-like protein
LTNPQPGKNAGMQSALDIREKQLALLKTLELEEVCETIAEIITNEFSPNAVGVVLWDQDFESYSEKYKYTFGAGAEEMMDLVDDLIMQGRVDEGAAVTYKVLDRENMVALVLVTGAANVTERELETLLGEYPLKYALANCYEVAELREDAERRERDYASLEEQYHEEKRLNSQAGIKQQKFKAEQADKDKLILQISNNVRSDLKAELVLNKMVTEIGKAYAVSRCLVIRPMSDLGDYRLYEYNAENVSPAVHLFNTPKGEEFVRLAAVKSGTHEFLDNIDPEGEFDSDFLSQFELKWGMLVPLICKDRNIGSLFLQDCAMLREWSIDNTAYLGSLADMLAIHIENANLHEEKERQAVTDGLTGISNRRYFNEMFSKEFERAKRYGTTLSLVIFDLDFLKKINDTYGHHVGDEAIKSIGSVVGKSCRAVDVAARFGGEEFCLLLPETDIEDATRLAERVRKLINETYIEGPGLISASIGVATFPHHANEQDELFAAADHALYAAKQSGRNRVCAATPTEQ